MRIGIIGDVHADHRALASAIHFLRAREPDHILCTGDICDGPGDVDACVQLLRENSIPTVVGNHDEWCIAGEMRTLEAATRAEDLAVATQRYLQELPKTIRLDVDGAQLVLCHGVLDNTMNKVNEDDFGYAIEANEQLQQFIHDDTAQIMINGHSHRQMVRRFGAKLMINGGTINRVPDRCVALADFSVRSVTFYPYSDGKPVEIAGYQRAMK